MFRSLVIAPASVREAVMSQPLIATLARRGEVVAVAASPDVAPVYRAMGVAVAQVYELPLRPGRVDWSLRRSVGANWRRRYDVAYVLSDALPDALLPWFAGVPRRIGHAGSRRPLLINEPPVGPQPRSGVARFLALAGEREGALPQPALAPAPERLATVCEAHGVKPGGYWVLAPGGDGAPARCWSPGQHAQLMRQLHGRTGCPVLLMGSGQDVALAQHIAAEAAGVPSLVLAGSVGLDDAMALLAASAGVLAGDNGWMQLASALGVPQVALFGPTTPDDCGPLHRHTRVLRLEPAVAPVCAPCNARSCPPGHGRCLRDLGPDQVLEALLAQARQAAEDPLPSPPRRVGASTAVPAETSGRLAIVGA